MFVYTLTARMSRSSRTLYVDNLPGDIRESEVEDLFYKYGPIVHMDLKIQHRPPLGYAIVEFEDARDAEDAIRGRDDFNFDGHRLRVELADGGCGHSSSSDRHNSHSSSRGPRGGVSRRSENRGEQSLSPSSCQMPPGLEDNDGKEEPPFQATQDLEGLSEGDGIAGDGVNIEPPHFTAEDSGLPGYNFKKRKVPMLEKLASSIDEMVRFWKEKSASASSALSGSSAAQDDVDVCLHLLEQLSGVDYSSDFYRFGVILFTKPEYRRIFMKLPNEETRKQFLIDAMRADNGS